MFGEWGCGKEGGRLREMVLRMGRAITPGSPEREVQAARVEVRLVVDIKFGEWEIVRCVVERGISAVGVVVVLVVVGEFWGRMERGRTVGRVLREADIGNK